MTSVTESVGPPTHLNPREADPTAHDAETPHNPESTI